MNSKANYIKQRLSLREPLKEALDIVAQIADTFELKKDADITTELAKVKELYPTCTDFERDFPSICFSIATGIGKTRLMGACVAYLHLHKGIKNFFILAPNLTIYDKLIDDFGNPANPKYVFNGISEFVHNQPVIITGDNYSDKGNLFKESEVRINIFNIAKFNSENKVTKSGGVALPPRIKRLSEYLGQSYWEYLSNLTDLVILMDEAHRYHADASKNAINELKPVLGLELTATPIDEKGKSFKNVVYEYSLAQALTDGKYIKNPAIATRKNFDPKGKSPEEIEIIKLEDAISLHEDTKNELEIYARTFNVKLVKPFILIVCRDITHAKDVFNYINSNEFYKGAYKNKALQIDSSTRSEEDIEKQFLSLEQSDNEIEIVIHVNMLKEGWDVTNLYTIVPLRAANASVLVEQTIGRGLRLPFKGERTGVEKVDKLTVVAHDNFSKVIEEAQNPNSVLNKLSYIEIPEEDFNKKGDVVTSANKTEIAIQKEEEKIAKIQNEPQKQKAQNYVDAKKLLIQTLNDPAVAYNTAGLKDFNKEDIKSLVINKAIQKLETGQQTIFKQEIIDDMSKVYDATLVEVKNNIIEIPRMDLVLQDTRSWYEDFDLDTSTGFNFKVLDEQIIRQNLKDNNTDTIGVIQGAFIRSTPAQQLISELLNIPEIDYDDNAELLNKLVSQALQALQSHLDENESIVTLVKQYRRFIAMKIYEQMKTHFKISTPEYSKPKVLPFVEIKNWHFTTQHGYGYKDYRESITPVSAVPKYVFKGFEKACHFEYKFDSNTEKVFSQILESDKKVIKWLRPAKNQFRIYWDNNTKEYNPDFVVETDDCFYIVEPKADNEINTVEVQAKKAAAIQYCKYATEFTTSNGGNPWKYLLIPHTDITITTSFDFLVNKFKTS